MNRQNDKYDDEDSKLWYEHDSEPGGWKPVLVDHNRISLPSSRLKEIYCFW